MRITVFLNALGFGGTEKAASRWARGLTSRGHEVLALALLDGPRRQEFESAGIEVRIVGTPALIATSLREHRPEVIHAHAPGHPHTGDILGQALATLPKIPVMQTNIFGQLDNLRENAWTDFRAFVSWTSCIQAARRNFLALDESFFQRHSVASNPLDPPLVISASDIREFRQRLGVGHDELLFGRLSRPEPNKWTDLPLTAFRRALRSTKQLRLLLREPPAAVAKAISRMPERDRFIILPATSDSTELDLTIASLDAVLHASKVGESFGYGIAEPMNHAKPVIANSTPWGDQAQIELVRHGETGFIASTEKTMAAAIIELAGDSKLREKFGRRSQAHIQNIADTEVSLERLENAFHATITGTNRLLPQDLIAAKSAISHLDEHQFGHTWREQMALRPFHYRVRFRDFRKSLTR